MVAREKSAREERDGVAMTHVAMTHVAAVRTIGTSRKKTVRYQMLVAAEVRTTTRKTLPALQSMLSDEAVYTISSAGEAVYTISGSSMKRPMSHNICPHI